MEAFEQFVAVALEAEGFVVTSGVKFSVRRKTKKKSGKEYQTHGYEVDLVGARANHLVLASVKSFFGSRGVSVDDLDCSGKHAGRYRLLNDPVIRSEVVRGAAERYGYQKDQVSLRLYAGKLAGDNASTEAAIGRWCAAQSAASVPMTFISISKVVDLVRSVADDKRYKNNQVVVAVKALSAAGVLMPKHGT